MAIRPPGNKSGSRTSFHAARAVPGSDAPDIPVAYHETYLYAMVQDPHHLFVFWEIGQDSAGKTGASRRRTTGLSRSAIRLLQITGRAQEEPKTVACIPVEKGSSSAYIRAPEPGSRYRIEFGLTTRTGRFRLLCGSKEIDLPLKHLPDAIRTQAPGPAGTQNPDASLTQGPAAAPPSQAGNSLKARTDELIAYSLCRGVQGCPAFNDSLEKFPLEDAPFEEYVEDRVIGSRHLFSTAESLPLYL